MLRVSSRMAFSLLIGFTIGVTANAEAPRINAVAADLAAFQRTCRGSGSLGFLLDPSEQTWSSTVPDRSFQDLQTFIRENNITSPRTLVTRFRAAPQNQWPQSSVLLSHSNSAQQEQIDPQNPRILLYGNGLVIGATGHSGAATSQTIAQSNNRVEVLRYNAAENRYQFGLLDFNDSPPSLTEPASCLRCHGEPPRPIWQPLQFWDHLTRVNVGTAFARENSIYSDLGNRSMDNWRGLLNFTSYLDHLSLRHTAQTLLRSENYARYRYATLAAVLQCSNIPGFLGDEAASHQRVAGSIETLTQNTEERVEQNNRSAVAFAEGAFQHVTGRITTSSLSIRDSETIAALRFIFEGRGVSLRNLSSRRPRGRNSYGYGFLSSGNVAELGTRELACFLLPDAVNADPRLAPLVARRRDTSPLGHPANDEECDLLRRLSLEAIRGAGGARSSTSNGSTH